MTLRVYLPGTPNPRFAETLTRLVDPGVELCFGPEQPEQAEWSILVDGRPTPERLAASPDLTSLIVPWAGLPSETVGLMRQRPSISVHNLHYNAVATAEMAMALLLAAAKRIVPADRRLRSGDWGHPEDTQPSLLLEGRSALVLGLGCIGRRVARACRGLGMTVVAVRRFPGGTEDQDADEVHGPAQVPELMTRANVVLICLPETDRTRGLLGRPELECLPADAILVNVSRGSIVDEQALYDGLRDGRPAAAGIDTWFRYPGQRTSDQRVSPSRLPFEALDNVVMSPHRAGRSEASEELRGAHLAVMLNVALRGERMHNEVDLAEGY